MRREGSGLSSVFCSISGLPSVLCRWSGLTSVICRKSGLSTVLVLGQVCLLYFVPGQIFFSTLNPIRSVLSTVHCPKLDLPSVIGPRSSISVLRLRSDIFSVLYEYTIKLYTTCNVQYNITLMQVSIELH